MKQSTKIIANVAIAAVGCLLTECAATAPRWFSTPPQAQRRGAYDWFLIAGGQALGESRTDACEGADDRARLALKELLIDRAESQSDVVAATGGPSRVRHALSLYADDATRGAPRTHEFFDDAARHCYVQLQWLLPRHLAEAVQRAVPQRATESDAGIAMQKALVPTGVVPNDPRSSSGRASAALTPGDVVQHAYPGWYMRELPVPGCDTHRIVFVGAPRGGEARWLELKAKQTEWFIIADERIGDEGWPTEPSVALCD